MSRQLRPDIEDGLYHVMNRGIDHGTVYFHDRDRIEFGQRLLDAHERFGVLIYAYCLMDNHYHLLVHCPDGGLSDAMQRIGSIYTLHVNDRLGRDGALFRGRFHSRRIESDEYLLAACRYIHRNALEVPGVADPAGYRWSSHRTYLGFRASPPWLRTGEVLAHFDNDATAFDRFVCNETDGCPSALTSAEARMQFEAVSIVLAERMDSSVASAGVRSVLIAWVLDRSPADQALVAEMLGMSGSNAWRCAASRARIKLRGDPALLDVARRASDLVFSGRSRLGSDPNRDGPWRDQRAARAAS